MTPVHASSMVESTADDHLVPSTVTQMFVVGADPEHAACTLYGANPTPAIPSPPPCCTQ